LYQLKKDGIKGKFHTRNKEEGEIDKGLRTDAIKIAE